MTKKQKPKDLNYKELINEIDRTQNIIGQISFLIYFHLKAYRANPDGGVLKIEFAGMGSVEMDRDDIIQKVVYMNQDLLKQTSRLEDMCNGLKFFSFDDLKAEDFEQETAKMEVLHHKSSMAG